MKIGFIGAGNMGSALVRAAVECPAVKVYIYDKDEAKARAVADSLHATAVAAPREIASECDFVFLAVKPNIIPEAISELGGSLRPEAVLVSMAAGVQIRDIEAKLPDTPIIRIMPNTPCAVSAGMVLWCANRRLTEERECAFLFAMGASGRFAKIDEADIDAGTAVSGCGPAFVYMFIDALARGGAEAGLDPARSLELACQTVAGAAKMAAESGRTPEELRIAVCSPGGSTIEGVKALMGADFDKVVRSAVAASYKRTCELGK